MESIEKQIKRAIINYKHGKIFFPSNFLKFGTSTAIRQALNRLEDKGLLVRLAHGIYLYPKKHKTLGILYPSIEDIAMAISKRDKARIIPTGVYALNRLGLSTQVPLNIVYLTDGTSRSIKVKKRSIKFKKASPKLLSAKNDTNILVIQALREIGKENVDSKTLKIIKEALSTVEKDLIKQDMKVAPSWIAEIMKTSINE